MQENAKKKILFAITKSNFGGAQRYVYDLATSLPKNEFEIAVILGDGGELEQKLQDAGIRTIRINSLQRDVSIFKDIAVFFELIRIFTKENPDIIHLNSTKIGGVGAFAGRVCRIHKIIFTAHGWAFNEKRSRLSKAVISFLQWLTVIFSHTTIAVSQKTSDQILTFPFININKIKVIYNGISKIDFVDRNEARKILFADYEENMSEEKLWIGTISELHTNKGIDIALDAIAELAKRYKNIVYIAIGGGEEQMHLNEQIKKLGIYDQAFLVGQIPDAKKYLKAFDIFTLTSRTEALPYAIMEAGLAQLPVVASNVGGIPEIINTPENGVLVATGEKAVHEITNAIEKLIVQPEERRKLGHNLERHIHAQFSKDKMLAATFALYK